MCMCVCDSSFVQGKKSSYETVGRQSLARTSSLRAKSSCVPPKVSLQTVVARVRAQGQGAAMKHKPGPF